MSMPGGSPTLSMRLPAGKPGTSSLKAAAGNSRAAKMKCVSMAMGDVPELPSTVALEPVDDGDGDEDAQRIGAAYEGYAAGGGAAGANLSMVLRSRQNHEKPLRRDPYSKRYRPSLLNRDMRPDVSQMLLMHQQEPMRHGVCATLVPYSCMHVHLSPSMLAMAKYWRLPGCFGADAVRPLSL
eukprot:XP_001699470.1 predicted protein [Chlamydomonas reinhardtii]